MCKTNALLISLTAVALAASLCFTPTARAIQPGVWVHTTEADFEPGTPENVITTNLGDLKLATATTELAGLPEEASIVYDLQRVGDDVYIAAGPEAQLLRLRDGEVEVIRKLKGQQIFALGEWQGGLLVAVSGTSASGLATLGADDRLVVRGHLPEVRYIWDMLAANGKLILATGTEGQILSIDLPEEAAGLVDEPAAPEAVDEDAAPADDAAEPEKAANDDADDADEAEAADEADGGDEVPAGPPATPLKLGGPALEPTVIFDTEQANVLCLGQDARGTLYAGTDSEGLVYRFTPKQDGEGYEAFVLYDASEPEIGALIVRPDGTVFAGTADAEQARPGRLQGAASEETGRPQVPGEQPAGEGEQVPDPGDLPGVAPGQEPVGEENAAPVDAAPDGGAEADDAADVAPEPAAEPVEPAEGVAATEPVEGDVADAPQPTAEQFDRLREVVRKRLMAARKSGELQAGRPGQMAGRPGPAQHAGGSRSRPAAAPQQAREGNAIYRIDPDGFVAEVFRESVMILRLVDTGDQLLVATGNEGQVFQLDPKAEETTILVDLEGEQVPALLVDADGGILLGTANPARLHRLSEGVAPTGTYTSVPLDASQISLWGTFNLTADVPEGASVTVETRSGNVSDPEKGPWSVWSQAQVLMPNPDLSALQPREIEISSPPARFLQYRLTLTGGGEASPTIDRVQLAYVTPNLRPHLASLKAEYPQTERDQPPSPAMNVAWEASDPNGDALLFQLDYRKAGSEAWVKIKDKLRQPSLEWNTRLVPDGRYVLRVTASDRRDNPGDMALTTTRQSDPVLIDTTPPAFEGVQTKLDGGRLTITGTVKDAFSAIGAIAYVLDSEEEPSPVLPDDLIFDSTSETWVVTISDLAPGPHVVTLRARDARGNVSYESVSIDVK